MVEIQQEIGAYIQLLARKALSRTSDKALMMFARETINILTTLEKKEPILCIKNLYPGQYGSLEITKYLSKEELMPMMDALSYVITDSHITSSSKPDIAAAAELMERIVVQLGDDANYLEAQNLQNREEYSKGCKAAIHFYELILSNKTKIAGNGLRYAFSP